MDWPQAVVLGIIEGVTEFLPISSTGHMILVSQWWGIVQTEFVKSFEIIIQLGAIAAVVVEYGRKWGKDREAWKRIGVGFAPSAIVGVVGYEVIKKYLLGQPGIVAVALATGAVGMVAAENWLNRQKNMGTDWERLGWSKAVGVGWWQTLAMIPGVSRSAATIIGGQMEGLTRTAAVEYSFALAVPTMVAATGLDVVSSGWSWSWGEWLMLIGGGITAFITAKITVKWLWRYVQRNDLRIFALYRLVLAGVWLMAVKSLD